MGLVGRPVDLACLELLVGDPAIAQLQHAHDTAVRRLERDLGADDQTLRTFPRDRQGNWHRPDQAVFQPPLAEHVQIVPLGHETLERRVSANSYEFQIARSALVELYPGHAGRTLKELLPGFAANESID